VSIVATRLPFWTAGHFKNICLIIYLSEGQPDRPFSARNAHAVILFHSCGPGRAARLKAAADVLSAFFDRTQLTGRLFFAGKVDGTLEIDKPEGGAFLHILEHGGFDLVRPGLPNLAIREPAILLCPGACLYKLRAAPQPGAQIICATFEFGAVIGRALPFGLTDTMIFTFSQLDEMMPVVHTLLGEFRADRPGRQKGMNVLFEYIFLLLVRQAIGQGTLSQGLLFSMLDPQLGRALDAIHQAPEQAWGLVELAELAGMSRSRFAARFAELVGMAPIAYLAAWRIKLAQDMMARGVALKIVAASVGFSSQAGLTRAFVHETGLPPGEWNKRRQNAAQIGTPG